MSDYFLHRLQKIFDFMQYDCFQTFELWCIYRCYLFYICFKVCYICMKQHAARIDITSDAHGQKIVMCIAKFFE